MRLRDDLSRMFSQVITYLKGSLQCLNKGSLCGPPIGQWWLAEQEKTRENNKKVIFRTHFELVMNFFSRAPKKFDIWRGFFGQKDWLRCSFLLNLLSIMLQKKFWRAFATVPGRQVSLPVAQAPVHYQYLSGCRYLLALRINHVLRDNKLWCNKNVSLHDTEERKFLRNISLWLLTRFINFPSVSASRP